MPPAPAETARLAADIEGPEDLTWFVPVVLDWDDEGREHAHPRLTNTSGDFATLAATDGFIELAAGSRERRAGETGGIFRW